MAPNDPKIKKIVSAHNLFCNCTPKWSHGKWGQELKCSTDGSLLWWPTPDLSGLTEEQKLALTLGLPMKYDVDAEDIDEYLFEGGYAVVTPENYSEAFRHVVKQLEKALWQDNVGKQLLGRLAVLLKKLAGKGRRWGELPDGEMSPIGDKIGFHFA